MIRIEQIRRLLIEAAGYPDASLTFETVCELLHLWDTRDTALRALVQQWRQEAADASNAYEPDADERAKVWADVAEQLARLLEPEA